MTLRFFSRLTFTLAIVVAARGAERIAFTWPTPNDAFATGKPLLEALQHAGSGDPESGGFGCVRSAGHQFHEGIDIKPVSRDRRGEPTDEIFAAMDGVVRHINAKAGESSYGRYVVIEHPEVTPAVYTLYAHLSATTAGLKVGDRVKGGQVIATMGHTAGGYAIPRDRAHLHFEIGLWVTRDFQSWYAGRKFGSPNEQGLYNGMNLMGFDPLDFLQKYRAHQVDNFQQYLARMEPAVRIRVATSRIPDFAQRYPSLRTKELPMLVGGWEITVNWTGLPIALAPLTTAEVIGLTTNQPVVVEANAELTRRMRCKTLVAARRGGGWGMAKDLETMLQQMFALR